MSFFPNICFHPLPYSYKRPRSAGPRLQNRHPKQDYSNVEAKVDTGRGSHSKEAERKETHGAGGVVSHRRWATTGSHEVCDACACHTWLHAELTHSSHAYVVETVTMQYQLTVTNKTSLHKINHLLMQRQL